MSREKMLLVEGVDDAHAIRNLCYENGISICIHDDRYSGEIEIYASGGRDKNKIGSAIATRLNLTELTHLGVVVDADDDVDAAFQSVIAKLSRHADWSYPDVQDDLTSDGWIGEAKLSTGDSVRVGVWIMPDNVSPGALEDFAAKLVPPNDRQWTHAGDVVENIPEPRFKRSHRGKAHMHTYLAWQDPPREPIGRSISSGTLHANSDLANRFVAWMKRLYNR